MRDTAIKLIGLRALRMDAWDDDDYDRMFEFDEEIGDTAHELALEVIEHDPFEHQTRMGEVFAYANRRGICVHAAIAELVNTALSLGARLENKEV